MKHYILTIYTLALLALGACTKEQIDHTNDANGNEEAKMVEVAIIADADDTRLGIDGNITHWEVGDRITLGLNAGWNNIRYSTLSIASSRDISADGKSATFRGSVPEGEFYALTAVYPGMDVPSKDVTLDREAVDNIFMSSYKRSEDNPIKVTDGSEIPITFSHLMHKMDFNISLASGYQSDDLDSENIAIEISGTENGTPINFATRSKYNMTSNSLTNIDGATSTSIFAYGNSNNLYTMLFPMGSTSNVTLTFGVYIDGEKRYEIVKPTQSMFRMSAGKSTKVNLVLDSSNSIESGGTIEQEPITLNASTTTIKANGVDGSTLSVVTDKGHDVTIQSNIYVNGARLNGTRFATTSAGTYTLYAERYGIRSNELTITAEEVTVSGKTIVFADGVTLTSGWYDVNKMAQGNNGDVSMCWAAASSNMIQWFQDRYVAAGNTLPATAITGRGTKMHEGFGRTYELALMDLFHSEWEHMPKDAYGVANSRGCHAVEAIPWYFEGVNYGKTASAGSQAYPKSDGGYWKSVWSDIYPMLYHEYNYMFYWYKNLYTGEYMARTGWEESCSENYSVKYGISALELFSQLVVDFIDRGVCEMTISLNANGSLLHATTLWGYEIDKGTGLITRLWITDSDDLEKEPKEELLNEYSVSYVDGSSFIKLTSPTVRYGEAYVTALQPFSGYGSAE